MVRILETELGKPGWSAVLTFLDVQLPSVPLSTYTEWTKIDNGDSWFMITEYQNN